MPSITQPLTTQQQTRTSNLNASFQTFVDKRPDTAVPTPWIEYITPGKNGAKGNIGYIDENGSYQVEVNTYIYIYVYIKNYILKMKIRRFNEAEEMNISNERVEEIINELSSMTSDINEKTKSISTLAGELENYRSKSKQANNQIDDASLNMDSLKSKLDESTTLLDNIIDLLQDYTEGGEKYLY